MVSNNVTTTQLHSNKFVLRFADREYNDKLIMLHDEEEALRRNKESLGRDTVVQCDLECVFINSTLDPTEPLKSQSH